MREYLKRFLEIVLELIFPKEEKVIFLEKLISARDLRSLPKADNSFQNHFSLFSYKDPLVKELVWQIKYHKHPLFTKEVGVLLYEEILDMLSDKELFDGNSETLLIPVPMSLKRRRLRGFNQTEEIAKAIIANDNTNALSYSQTLISKKETKTQTEMRSKEERMKNAVGAYIIQDRELVKNKKVIVIDDVRTTGVTFREIEYVLRQAGASEVFCFSIAH